MFLLVKRLVYVVDNKIFKAFRRVFCSLLLPKLIGKSIVCQLNAGVVASNNLGIVGKRFHFGRKPNRHDITFNLGKDVPVVGDTIVGVGNELLDAIKIFED